MIISIRFISYCTLLSQTENESDSSNQTENVIIAKDVALWHYSTLPEAGTGGALQKRCSWKFRKIHGKTPVPESLF